MTPIFTKVMEGVILPSPWQPTHIKSYAKGRAPFRVWVKLVTDREAEKNKRDQDRQKHKPMDDLIRKIAKETRQSQRSVRKYLVTHSKEIFT